MCYNQYNQIRRNHMKKLLLAASFLALLLFASCAEKTPSYPVQKNDILKMEFQNGALPDASYFGAEDTEMNSASPDTNYNAINTMNFGSTGSNTRRTLIRFDLTRLVPANVEIVKAYLNFYMIGVTSYLYTFTAYRPAKAWVTGSATWNEYYSSLWTTPGGDYGSAASDSVFPDAYKTHMTLELDAAYIQTWLDHPNVVYGLLIKSTIEDTASHYVQVASSEYGTPAYRPKLTIYYRLP